MHPHTYHIHIHYIYIIYIYIYIFIWFITTNCRWFPITVYNNRRGHVHLGRLTAEWIGSGNACIMISRRVHSAVDHVITLSQVNEGTRWRDAAAGRKSLNRWRKSKAAAADERSTAIHDRQSFYGRVTSSCWPERNLMKKMNNIVRRSAISVNQSITQLAVFEARRMRLCSA